MKINILIILLGALLLTACGKQAGEIEAKDAWIRPAMQAENSAMYMLLQNHTSQDDELVDASSGVADMVELHKSMMDSNGTMQMMHQDSVPLSAGAEVEFAPGGLHIMFTGLKRDLKAGDRVEVVLHFKNHADIPLTVPVQDAQGEQMPMGESTHTP